MNQSCSSPCLLGNLGICLFGRQYRNYNDDFSLILQHEAVLYLVIVFTNPCQRTVYSCQTLIFLLLLTQISHSYASLTLKQWEKINQLTSKNFVLHKAPSSCYNTPS